MTTTAELLQKMEDIWNELSKHRAQDIFILTKSLRRARQTRRWRGKRYNFRALHRGLRGKLVVL